MRSEKSLASEEIEIREPYEILHSNRHCASVGSRECGRPRQRHVQRRAGQSYRQLWDGLLSSSLLPEAVSLPDVSCALRHLRPILPQAISLPDLSSSGWSLRTLLPEAVPLPDAFAVRILQRPMCPADLQPLVAASRAVLTRIIHGPTPTRSVSEDWVTSCPRLLFGLVWRAVRRDFRPVNNPY